MILATSCGLSPALSPLPLISCKEPPLVTSSPKALPPARFTLKDLLTATSATLIHKPAMAASCQQFPQGYWVCTDSRDPQQCGPGSAFLPLVGDRFDAHTFCAQAAAQGVSILIVNTTWWQTVTDKTPYENTTVLAVDDTLGALQQLAHYHRRQRCQAVTVIALTGSSGKTTVKELLTTALKPHGPTAATFKNHNNDIGAAQTLLNLTGEERFLVIEMGMRGLGEIGRLSRMATPNIALLLNIGPAHIGRLGSLENIAIAKSEIAEGLDAETGCLIWNGDDPQLQRRVPEVWPPSQRQQTFNQHQWRWVDTSQQAILWQPDATTEPVRVQLAAPGPHQAMNVACVLTVVHSLGLDVALSAEALTSAAQQPAIEGRWQPMTMGDLTIIHDAYNANPASMKASLESFFLWQGQQPQPGSGLLVLGAMEELGPLSRAYHLQLGESLFARAGAYPGWQRLILIGENAQPTLEALDELQTCPPAGLCSWFATIQEALPAIANACDDLRRHGPITLLLKGSRSHQLEQVLTHLQPATATGVTP